MATKGYLEKGLELDLTQLCPLQTILEEVGETVHKIEVKSPTCPWRGVLQAPPSRPFVAPAWPDRHWPRRDRDEKSLE